MKDIFIEMVPSYELRDGGNICLPKVKTMRFGTETVRFLGQRLRRTLPADIKEPESLSVFKRKIKTYTVGCDCRLCKRYVEHLGYIKFLVYFLIVVGLNYHLVQSVYC